MIFEHFALNVKDPYQMKVWYAEHLGLKIVSEMSNAPFMIFLADSSDRVVCELYHNTDAPLIDFKHQHHLSFHMAFESKDAANSPVSLRFRLFIKTSSLHNTHHLQHTRHVYMQDTRVSFFLVCVYHIVCAYTTFSVALITHIHTLL